MASKREQVIEAVFAMIKVAVPNAQVERNPSKAAGIWTGGTVNVRDGDPGEPEVTLSPLTYTYAHRIEIEMAALDGATKPAGEQLDDMMTAIGARIDADPTLGGLCDWLTAEAPNLDPVEVFGAEPGRWADFGIVATYSTLNPLT